MDSTEKSQSKQYSSPAQRTRRKIAREVGAVYEALLRAAGFAPGERRVAWAIELALYENPSEDPETPRPIPLALIGRALTSTSDLDKAKADRAREGCGNLFLRAIPRNGYQIQSRFKAGEDEGRPHEYASHAFPVAALVAELWAEEKEKILKDRSIEKKSHAIEAALDRLVAEGLDLLPRCEAEIVRPTGETYAFVSAPEAKAYCQKNPGFSIKAFEYTPPATDEPAKKPFYDQDLKRIKDRIKATIENQLDEISERNGYDQARLFSTELDAGIHKLLTSWAKVAGANIQEDDTHEELIHRGETRGVDLENPPVDPSDTPPESGGVEICNPIENNDLQPPVFETVKNFDDAAAAADFYIRDGWAVVACCQFDPTTGLCTGPEKHQKDPKNPCRGKRPLIRGRKDAKPGDGYTAATRDRGLARDWFTRQFPDAGVAIRLDGHILIDCDVKDGGQGIESYQILADTFDLPATLSAITPSGGRHHIFKLPDDLPADFLGSWTRVLDSADLNDIDIKVGNRGLAHVEPSRGVAGVYRWLDPTAEIAELPRECCDYLHGVHEKEQQKTLEKAKAVRPSDCAQTFDPDDDQTKYVKDMPAGERHPRLRSIACALAARGASVEQIVEKLKFHDSQFREAGPTNDFNFMARVASGAVLKFAPEVAAR